MATDVAPAALGARGALPAWGPNEALFYTVTAEALAGGCSKLWRRPPALRAPPTTPPAAAYNRTLQLLRGGAPQWHVLASAAVEGLSDLALTLRAFCSAFPTRCREVLGAWGAGWCLLRRRLQAAARHLPEVGRVVSALGTSAAAVVRTALPLALALPLAGLANGKVSVGAALLAVENATAVLAEHLECALVLGEELRDFGRGRVRRAIFHGDAGRHARWPLPAADVLLGLLARAGSSCEGGGGWPRAAPQAAREATESAGCSGRLLSIRPVPEWLEVDLSSARGAPLEARPRLRPWLAARAGLLLAWSSGAGAAAAPSRGLLDLAFVDAAHSLALAAGDLATWAPCVRPGGLVAGHDYSRAFVGVVEAAHAALPRGAALHLAPGAVFWWRAARGGRAVREGCSGAAAAARGAVRRP